MDLTPEKWAKWRRKRKNTVYGFLIICVVGGMDYSIVFATLYIYLTSQVKTDKPNLYYGLIIAVYSCSSTLVGLICGRLIDKYRKMRLYANITLVLQIIGSLIYVIPFSPAYLLVGRLIAGAGDTFSSTCSGETVRIFDSRQATSNIWKIAAAYSVGFALGPGLGIFFKNISFDIWIIHVDYTNFVGIFIAGLLFIALILANALIHDCSLEFDLKAYLRKHDLDFIHDDHFHVYDVHFRNFELESDSEMTSLLPEKGKSTAELLKVLLKNPNVVLILLSSFFFMYCLFASDVLLPLIILELIKWDITALTLIFVVYGVTYFFALMIFSRLCTSNFWVSNMTIICISLQMVGFGLFIAMKLFPRNFTTDVILMIAFLVSYIFVWFIEEVLLRCILAKMVPSHVQSFTESLRNGFSRAATVLAALTAPMVLVILHYWSMALLGTTFIFLLIFLSKRKSFKDTEIMLI